MKIARFVRPRNAYVEPYETLRTAAARMRTSGLSALPVIAQGAVVALVTERDLVKAMAVADRPGSALVADVMRSGPVTVAPEDPTPTALLRMLAIGCLDLPVVSDRKLVGSVAARELLAAQAEPHGIAV